ASAEGELLVAGHLGALVPGERSSDAVGELTEAFLESSADPFGGEPVDQVDQQQIARGSLDDRPDRSPVPAAHDQVALPVTRRDPVGDLPKCLFDERDVGVLAAPFRRAATPRRTTWPASA